MARALSRFTFGGRLPAAVGLLLVATVVASLAAAIGSRHMEPPLLDVLALRPDRVLTGEIWRLVTWVFVEPSAIWLVIDCLTLAWLGRDLADEWGSKRFLTVYFAIVLVAAAGTSALAFVDRAILGQSYLGGWALVDAMIVAWGLWFPDRTVRLFFILAIRGEWLAWLTIGLTIVFAAYMGWERMLPNLLAEGAMVGWLFRRSILGRWAAWRRDRRERERARAREARLATAEDQRKASEASLRSIEAADDDLPPMPPEVDATLGRILGEAGAARTKRGPKDDDR